MGTIASLTATAATWSLSGTCSATRVSWKCSQMPTKAQGAHFDPASTVGDPDDLAYYRHRAAGLLSHKPWQERNLGVKLIGFTQHREKIPTLLKMLCDRTPVSRIKRFFGGDFQQVGFIRRNIVQALEVMDYFRLRGRKTPACRRAGPIF